MRRTPYGQDPYGADPKPDPNLISNVHGIPQNSYTVVRFHDLATVELRFGPPAEKNVLVPVAKLDDLISSLVAARAKAVRIGTLEGVSPESHSESHVSQQKEARRLRLEERHKADALRMHAQGMGVYEIARCLRGRSPETIAAWIGVELPGADLAQPPHLREVKSRPAGEKLAEALSLHGEQMPPGEIAKRLGVGRATVYRWLKSQ